MEKIFNKLILVDNECQEKLDELKEKQDNIEYLVEEETGKRKGEIKTKYKFKIDMKKNDYAIQLAEHQTALVKKKTSMIEKMKKSYKEHKEKVIKDIIDSII